MLELLKPYLLLPLAKSGFNAIISSCDNPAILDNLNKVSFGNLILYILLDLVLGKYLYHFFAGSLTVLFSFVAKLKDSL
jgi:hypothetical protein